MCLILFAYDCHPQYQLVVAANRDEFYKRPTLPANFWPDNPDILAGKDLREGGTWTGITTAGRFAALTNYRDPSSYKREAPSRGHLVQKYLAGNMEPEAYIDNLPDGGAAYNGFNLLLGTPASLYYYSNRERITRRVEKGIHGLSNSLLDVPWPKVVKGTRALENIMQNDNISAESLFAMLADREQPDDRDLPETGVGLEMERILAPAFVISPNYGTGLSTVILVDRENNIQFWERSYINRNPDTWNEVYFEVKST